MESKMVIKSCKECPFRAKERDGDNTIIYCALQRNTSRDVDIMVSYPEAKKNTIEYKKYIDVCLNFSPVWCPLSNNKQQTLTLVKEKQVRTAELNY